MLGLSLDNVRLFLHVIAATIWVGGQLTLGALVPTLRGLGGDAPGVAARAYNRIAWPAFGVLVLTGIWNMAAESDKNHGAYAATLGVKMLMVVLSGAAAYIHTRVTSKRLIGITGGVSALAALLAVLFGIQLAG